MLLQRERLKLLRGGDFPDFPPVFGGVSSVRQGIHEYPDHGRMESPLDVVVPPIGDEAFLDRFDCGV